jgi:hypothetical protein
MTTKNQNIPAMKKENFAVYCGQSVIVLDSYLSEYGNLSLIQFEDGREDEVPTVTLDFLD